MQKPWNAFLSFCHCCIPTVDIRRVSSCGVENVSDTFDWVDVDWPDRPEVALPVGDLETAF